MDLQDRIEAQRSMASQRRNTALVQLPITPDEGQSLRDKAAQLAGRALNGVSVRGRHLKPSTLVRALIGSSRKGANQKERSYFDAFTEHKAAQVAGLEESGEADEEEKLVEDFREQAGLPRHRTIFLDDRNPSNTEWNRLNNPDREDVSGWEPVDNKEKDKIRSRKIPRSEWQSWATEFLVFASELSLLRKGARKKRRRSRKPDASGDTEWKLKDASMTNRLRSFARVGEQVGRHGHWISCQEFADGIQKKRQTAQAFLGQAGDWKDGGKGWVKRRPKPDNARGFFYALTPTGKKLLAGIKSET